MKNFKKLFIVVLFVAFVLSGIKAFANADVLEGEIYPDPFTVFILK